jgi:pimeloyl-ACP methyl ester carboxylesterase
MDTNDDDLARFAADGAPPLPASAEAGHVQHDGARIWFATVGTGTPVILLHGGLGHSGNWGHQVPALVSSGRRAVLIDSRGHGRSTRDDRPYSYELMASDVIAVMDQLQLKKAAVIGWSDGACTALVLAKQAAERVGGVFFFACNMDPSGVKTTIAPSAILQRCFGRHTADYARLSATPDAFKPFAAAVQLMQRTQPDYSAHDLGGISIPVAIVQAEHEEFIEPAHAAYLSRSIPDAELVRLPGVSHFAPLQRPSVFNAAMCAFLDRTGA